jgi:hypothetical protein
MGGVLVLLHASGKNGDLGPRTRLLLRTTSFLLAKRVIGSEGSVHDQGKVESGERRAERMRSQGTRGDPT